MSSYLQALCQTPYILFLYPLPLVEIVRMATDYILICSPSVLLILLLSTRRCALYHLSIIR